MFDCALHFFWVAIELHLFWVVFMNRRVVARQDLPLLFFEFDDNLRLGFREVDVRLNRGTSTKDDVVPAVSALKVEPSVREDEWELFEKLFSEFLVHFFTQVNLKP